MIQVTAKTHAYLSQIGQYDIVYPDKNLHVLAQPGNVFELAVGHKLAPSPDLTPVLVKEITVILLELPSAVIWIPNEHCIRVPA